MKYICKDCEQEIIGTLTSHVCFSNASMTYELDIIKRSIENWKFGVNRAYPMVITYHQIEWLVARVEELENELNTESKS